MNDTRYIDSDVNLGSSSLFNKLSLKKIAIFKLSAINKFSANIYNSIFNIAISKLNLPMFPNPGKSGGPNTANIKIYLCKLEFILLNKHVEYSDQHMGLKYLPKFGV